MLNKRNTKQMIAFAITLMSMFSAVTPAFALTSDLDYNFKTENKDEFYNRGETQVNINGAVPDFLHDVYDFTPQPVYDSQYGASIILPNQQSQTNVTNAPFNAPVGGYVAAPTQTTGMTQGTGTNGYIGTSNATNTATNGLLASNNTTAAAQTENTLLNNPNLNIAAYPSDQNVEKPQYPITTIQEVRNSNGSIGTLKIPKIGLTVTAYDGDTFAAMKKGIGHISSTSAWNSNIGLVGHNRGTSDYFGKLKKLAAGDEMTYSTKLGTRTYVVESVTRISETDWSKLQYTSDNRLTLLTCVEDVPSQRLCISAIEKR